MNNEIDAPQVRVVNADGDMVGVISVEEGVELADDVGLDLVEVSPNADPPVCKILDYGKYKYAEQKKANEARKKQKTIDIKEIKMRPGIDEHDYQVKMRSVRRFLDGGDKVKMTIRFRGREMAHLDLGMKVLDRVREEIDELAKVEQFPRTEGRLMTMVIAPK
ncbi:MAG: translation initiation factor IF-3 [Pseudomonadota bacterium]|nr:translation initiation factor IF-3 [Pseudomonadota bacterium]